MEISKSLFHNDTAHRSLSADPVNGILSCGFLIKPTDRFSHDTVLFSHYGAFLLLSGSGRYSDPEGSQIELTPGCFVQRMPGKPHVTEVTPDGKWLEFFVCFGRDYYEYMADQGLLSRNPVLLHPLTPPLVHSCSALLERFRTTPDDGTFSLFLSMQEFTVTLTQTALQESRGAWSAALRKGAELLCLAEPSFPSPVSVARQVGMEYDTFRKHFKAAFRCSPSAYQMQYRLNCSKQLLLDSGQSIQEIAAACRFADAFAFSKAFRRYYGLSPSQFRKHFSHFV